MQKHHRCLVGQRMLCARPKQQRKRQVSCPVNLSPQRISTAHNAARADLRCGIHRLLALEGAAALLRVSAPVPGSSNALRSSGSQAQGAGEARCTGVAAQQQQGKTAQATAHRLAAAQGVVHHHLLARDVAAAVGGACTAVHGGVDALQRERMMHSKPPVKVGGMGARQGDAQRSVHCPAPSALQPQPAAGAPVAASRLGTSRWCRSQTASGTACRCSTWLS